MIDLNICEPGDILISKHGAIFEYVSRTPWGHYEYLDHVIRYIEDVDGTKFKDAIYGTRTNDGFTFAKNRRSTDHDIVKIEKLIVKKLELI